LTASDGTRGEELGESVAVSGNTIVVGTPSYVVPSTNTEQGAAYVFTKPASGWTNVIQTARLTAEKGQTEELFGRGVSVSGNTIVVAAPFREVGKNTGQGAAYVFVKPASGWTNATQTAKLTAEKGAAKEFFGESVAVSGNTIVAGAPDREVGKNAMQGAADVFTRPASGWAGSLHQTAELTASDGEANDALGASVALSGNTIVAGADLHTVGKSANQGAAYVFVEPASGWVNTTQTAELTAEKGAAKESFGESVAVSGNTILAGAPDHEVGKSAEQGAVYVFVMPASGWAGSLTQTAELTASDGVENEVLGRSLAVSGNTIVAGARFKVIGKNAEQGAVYVFVMPASGWAGSLTQTAELTASNGTAGDSLGRSVAVSGDTIVAGAPDHAVGKSLAQGATYVFAAPPPSIASPLAPTLSSVSETAKSWREGNLLAQISTGRKGKKTPPVGTTFSFTLNESASVTFTFTEPASGRKVGKTCVAQTKKNKHKRRCTRTVVAGALRFSGLAGENKVRFEGLISKHKKLKPGSYSLLVTGTASGKHSTTRTLRFTIAAG
jgi:hypothetical protein